MKFKTLKSWLYVFWKIITNRKHKHNEEDNLNFWIRLFQRSGIE